MAGIRKSYTALFKPQVVLAKMKGERTVNDLAGQFGVPATLIHGWNKHLLQGAEAVFAGSVKAAEVEAQAAHAELFEQIGRLKMELKWLKKVGPVA